VLVALGTQHTMRISHIVICALVGCTIIFHIISQSGTILKKNIKHKMSVFILSTTFVRKISHSNQN